MIKWLRPSLEDREGKADPIKLTAFILVTVCIFVIGSDIRLGFKISFKEVITKESLEVMERFHDLVVTLLIVVLGAFGVFRVSEIIELVKVWRGIEIKSKEEEPEENKQENIEQ